MDYFNSFLIDYEWAVYANMFAWLIFVLDSNMKKATIPAIFFTVSFLVSIYALFVNALIYGF